MGKKYRLASRSHKNGTFKLTYLQDMPKHSAIKASNYFYVFSHRTLSQLGSSYCYNVVHSADQRSMAFGDSVGLRQGKLVLPNRSVIYNNTSFPNKLFRFVRS